MQNKHIISWLRFAAFFLFLGRAWEHISYNGPYSTLYDLIFSSNSITGKILHYLTGKTDDEFFSDPSMALIFDKINLFIGIVFIFSAFSILLVNKRKSIYRFLVKFGACLLILVSLGYFIEKNLAWGQFFEYSAQMVVPWLLLMAVKFKMKGRFLFITKLAIAITFICHGLYAIGYYPIPGSFQNMMINTFGLSNSQSILWLKIAAYLDFAFAIGIFIPKISKYFLYYGLVWGFATALARIIANINIDFIGLAFDQYTFEFLVRMPHFILPLILIKYKREIII